MGPAMRHFLSLAQAMDWAGRQDRAVNFTAPDPQDLQSHPVCVWTYDPATDRLLLVQRPR